MDKLSFSKYTKTIPLNCTQSNYGEKVIHTTLLISNIDAGLHLKY